MATGGILALGAAGYAGYEWPRPKASEPLARPSTVATTAVPYDEVRGFVSRPDLRPPVVKITRHLSAALNSGEPRFIFLATKGYAGPTPSQPGLLIMDRRGRVVWFKPVAPESPFDFNVQAESAKHVLTWWEGKVTAGTGAGTAKIGDSTYRTTQTVRAGDGLMADLHEFYLTAAGTALVTAYQKTTADLSSAGGSKKGAVLASHAQEVDLATGKVLLDWDSLDHVGLQESYQPVLANGAPFDYFHINSISELPNGNLLVSARNTWALYELERTTGKVLWRLNGKKSDFTMGPGAHFYWQHHSRAFPDGTFTVFDDGSSPPEERQSRALVLSVDTKAKHVSLKRAYQHPAGFIAANQGSVQLLANGHVFVGWGNQPYFSEFAQDGRLLLDGELPINVQSYRAFTHDWIGRPTELPSIAVRSNPAGGNLVYASWNGATEIKSWRVLAGKDTSSLAPVGDEEWTGFETAVAVNSSGPKFVALALDAGGKELRRSELTAPSAAGATG